MEIRPLLTGLLFMSAGALMSQAPYAEVLDQLHPEVHYVGALSLDSCLVVLSWSDPGGFGYNPKRLLTYSTTGELLNSFTLNTTWSHWKRSLTPSEDGGAWLVGPLDGCDVFQTGRILRFAPNGSIVLDRTYTPEELDNTLFNLWGMAQNTTDRLALVGSGIGIADTLGNILEYWDMPGLQSSGPLSWYRDSLLITCGNTAVHVRGEGGSLLNSRSLSTPIADLHVNGDSIWVLGNNTLFRLDDDLGTLDSIPLPTASQPRQFARNGNGASLQLGNELFRFSSDIGITSFLTPSLLEGQVIRAFAVKDTLVHAFGDQTIGSYEGGFMKSYSMNGVTGIHDVDVAVDAVSIDSLWLTYYPQSQRAYQYGDLSIVVTNSGTEALQDLMLAYRDGTGPITCGTPTEYMTFMDANIAPGESTTYAMSDLLLWVGELLPGEVIDHDVCVTALGPNDLMDRVPGNNTSCIPIDRIHRYQHRDKRSAFKHQGPSIPFRRPHLHRCDGIGPFRAPPA
ncbi:MAG: hypothetical protein IPN62_15650 [Flavobacteriales bacterium]|nr:hypothetical protein [Flavobacteriales bacterium]